MSICCRAGAWGQNAKFSGFFNSGYAHGKSISIFRRRAFLRTGNTLIKPNFASAIRSRDSLDRDRHNVTKKSRRRGLSKRRRDDGPGDGTPYIRVNGRGRSPERNYDDGAGEDYRIGTLSKINNIIYCKNDCLQSTT